MNYYIYIDENTIIPYQNEVLKRYVGDRLVKTISNPSSIELVEFGYKTLIEEPIPDYDEEIEYLDIIYLNRTDNIIKHYEKITQIELDIE